MESIVPIRFTIVCIVLLCTSCIVSRSSRPELTGIVCDYTGKPIAACKVGENITDSLGYFRLQEKRYREFTAPGMEAPPLFIHEEVSKEGYHTAYIYMRSSFGGGSPKGSKLNVDTIFLRKNNEQLSLNDILHNNWICSTTKFFDTLYLVADNNHSMSFIENDASFFDIFNSYYYGGVGDVNSSSYKGNLPDTILARGYYLHFQPDNKLKMQKVQAYRSQRADDTIHGTASFFANDRGITFLSTSMPELNGTYKTDTIELKWMILVRQTD